MFDVNISLITHLSLTALYFLFCLLHLYLRPVRCLIHENPGCCFQISFLHITKWFLSVHVNLVLSKGTFSSRPTEGLQSLSAHIYRIAELSKFRFCFRVMCPCGVWVENYVWPRFQPVRCNASCGWNWVYCDETACWTCCKERGWTTVMVPRDSQRQIIEYSGLKSVRHLSWIIVLLSASNDDKGHSI